MILLTPEIRAQLLANGRQRDVDHVPVVKLFKPVGSPPRGSVCAAPIGRTHAMEDLRTDGDLQFELVISGDGGDEASRRCAELLRSAAHRRQVREILIVCRL